jgi:hypothetical protein
MLFIRYVSNQESRHVLTAPQKEVEEDEVPPLPEVPQGNSAENQTLPNLPSSSGQAVDLSFIPSLSKGPDRESVGRIGI